MKISDAIAEVDTYCPNKTDVFLKVKWLERLDGRIIAEVVSRYPALEEVRDGFVGYSEDDLERDLVVTAPYDELYVHYIAAQIHLMLHEQTHYNNETASFNSILEKYMIHLNRTYRPGGRKRYRVR